MTLPFDTISHTGVLLPLFHEVCKKGFKQGKNPTEIVDTFFKRYQDNPSDKEKINLKEVSFIYSIRKNSGEIDNLRGFLNGLQINSGSIEFDNSKLETHTVETHIYRLRKKINDIFSDSNFIKSSKLGYTI